ncbi:hypothetical protein EVC30_008 [Rhizobium phage RHph_Y1_11]|nr:hypothetical protein EVC30_008 [Rhizobium phage RHph_Y1_11]
MANRLLLGQKAAGNFGLWITKSGIDVLTNTTVSNYLLSTDAGAWQIMYSATQALANNPSPGSAQTIGITIPNFGFRPLLLCAVSGSGGGAFPGGTVAVSKYVYTSNTAINVTVDGLAAFYTSRTLRWCAINAKLGNG